MVISHRGIRFEGREQFGVVIKNADRHRPRRINAPGSITEQLAVFSRVADVANCGQQILAAPSIEGWIGIQDRTNDFWPENEKTDVSCFNRRPFRECSA